MTMTYRCLPSRYSNDLYVLESLNEDKCIFDVEGKWDSVKGDVLKYIPE